MSGKYKASTSIGCVNRRAGVRSRRGAVALEFALVIPVYAFAIMSTVVGGVRIYHIQQYSAMAKYLARKAIVHGESADKLGPWGPATISGSFGDGSAVGNLMADKYNNSNPVSIYYRLTWPDGGNNGLRRDRVEVTISSSSSSDGNTTSTSGTNQGLGAFNVSSTVIMTIAH